MCSYAVDRLTNCNPQEPPPNHVNVRRFWFLIRTDHQALSWIYSTTDSSGRLMRWRRRLSEYTFDMVYKPGASHHMPDLLSRASTEAPTRDIHDDIPCLELAETANGLRTGRYTGTDTPEPVEFDDVVEAQQTDDYCVEMSTRVQRGTAKGFSGNEHHALYHRTPYGNQLVILKPLRERVLTLEHHATVAAHPGMNRMYYTMQKAQYWPSMVTDIHTTITMCTTLCPKPSRLAATHHALDAAPGYWASHGAVR